MGRGSGNPNFAAKSAAKLAAGFAASAAAGALLASCAAMPPQQRAVGKDTALTFFSAPEARAQIEESRAGGAAATAAAEPVDDATEGLKELDQLQQVAQACGAPAAQNAQSGFAKSRVVAPIVAAALVEAEKLAVEQIDRSLDEEAKKYTSTTAASTQPIDFYATLAPQAVGAAAPGGAAPALRSLCFRMSRRELRDVADSAHPADPKGAATLVADFIGRIDYEANTPTRHQVITLHPIRLFVHRLNVKSSDGQVAVTVKLSADVIALTTTSGVATKRAIDHTVAAEKFTLKPDGSFSATPSPYVSGLEPEVASPQLSVCPAAMPGGRLVDERNAPADAADAADAVDPGKRLVVAPAFAYVRYCPDFAGVQVPLPPWDYDTSKDGSYPAHDSMVATVSITQVGNLPWLLKNATKLLDKDKDKMAGTLVDQTKHDIAAK
jgi:hypothetical protein